MKAGLVILLAIFAGAFAAPQEKNGMECNLCKMLVKYVEDTAENEEPTIEGAIDHLGCDHLGPIKQICYNLVHEYLPMMIKAIEDGQPPSVVCGKELHMCASKNAVVKREAPKTKANAMECQLCKKLVQYVEKEMEDGEPTIEGAIDHLGCDHLGPIKQICYNLVHEYLPMMIKAIEDGQPPSVVCGKELHMCASKNAVVKREVFVNKHAPSEKSNGMECFVCKQLVQYVEKAMEDGEPTIEGAIDHMACDHFGFLKKQCVDLVHQYLPVMIEAVENGESPSKACAQIHMC